MKAKLPSSIRLHGNKYLFHGRIPKALLGHPFFEGCNGFYCKALDTSNLREAIRRRDEILATFKTLKEGSQEEKYDLWTKKFREEADQFIESNVGFDDQDYKRLRIDLLLADAAEKYGIGKDGYPKHVSDDDQIKIHALTGNKKSFTGGMKHTLNTLIKEREARKDAKGSSQKTLLKLKRGVSWFLDEIGQKDIKLDEIQWEDVQRIATKALNGGMAGKTLDGHFYALRTVWMRIHQGNPSKSQINPFSHHKVPTSDSNSYDAFTWDEIRDLWLQTDNPELKQIIPIAATTGARINEIVTLTTQFIKEADTLCYLIKLNEKGKTAHSSRILPVHPKLVDQLGEGWSYPKGDRSLSRAFMNLKNKVITNWKDPYTEKPRNLGFHSFRSSVSSYLVNEANYPEATASLYTGHKPDKKNGSAIIIYVKMPDLQKKLEMCLSLPWVFD